jgi:RNA polymerase sigma factor (TIGR02999 family)
MPFSVRVLPGRAEMRPPRSFPSGAFVRLWTRASLAKTEALCGIIDVMTDVTQVLSRIESGDPSAAEQLLPLVYEELRKLAAARLAQEKPGQTLQATGLVHEAYMRLVDVEKTPHWNSRGHFFGAAAEAMRRILVDQARRKQSHKRGGRGRRVPLDSVDVGFNSPSDELLDIDEALTRLSAEDPAAAHLIQLRYFAGLSIEDAAELVGISRSTAYEHWSYARVRLKTLLDAE